MWLRALGTDHCLSPVLGRGGQRTGHKHSVPHGEASGGPQRKGSQWPDSRGSCTPPQQRPAQSGLCLGDGRTVIPTGVHPQASLTSKRSDRLAEGPFPLKLFTAPGRYL